MDLDLGVTNQFLLNLFIIQVVKLVVQYRFFLIYTRCVVNTVIIAKVIFCKKFIYTFATMAAKSKGVKV